MIIKDVFLGRQYKIKQEELTMYTPKPLTEYEPYKGFHDLRDFKLPKKLFRILWRLQDVLNEMTENHSYYEEWHPRQWQLAKELSADYQLLLRQNRKN